MDAEQEALAVARARSWLRTGRAKTIRRQSGLSQADVARAVGADRAQISRWESGPAAPGRDSALRLAHLYDELEKITRDEEATGVRLS